MRHLHWVVIVGFALSACGGGDDEGNTTVKITPGTDVQTSVQTALLMAKDGQTIEFAAGTYTFTEEISLVGKKRIKIRGESSDRAAVTWNFAGLGAGSPNGFSADTVEDLVIENLTIVDPPGDGLKVTKATNVTFRNLHIKWTAGSVMTNGAYAIYPVFSKNVLVEGCLVEGASDAGIYVGQSEVAMVRNNTVKGNVTGIEIENTDDAEVVSNMAIDNVSGILVFNIPSLPRKTGARTKVHKNTIMANNHAPFAHGGIVAILPPGAAMIMWSNDDAEVAENTISGNYSTGIVIVSCQTVQFLSEGQVLCTDPAYDNFAEGSHIHDNVFTGNGTMPQGFYGLYPRPVQDILWDGVVNTGKPENGGLCIKNNSGATFAKINSAHPGTVVSTSLTPHDCTKAALAGVNVTWGQ